MSNSEVRIVWIVILLGAILISSVGLAQESDLKPAPKVDDTQVNLLEEKVNHATFETEFEEADNNSYDAAKKQSIADEKQLKSELANMKSQEKKLKKEKERAIRETEAAHKSLKTQQGKNEKVKVDLNVAKKEKDKAEAALAKVKANVATLQTEERALAEERRKLDMMSKMAIDERKHLLEKAQQIRTNMANERKRQQAQQKHLEQYRQRSKQAQQRINKAENPKAAAAHPRSQ